MGRRGRRVRDWALKSSSIRPRGFGRVARVAWVMKRGPSKNLLRCCLAVCSILDRRLHVIGHVRELVLEPLHRTLLHRIRRRRLRGDAVLDDDDVREQHRRHGERDDGGLGQPGRRRDA